MNDNQSYADYEFLSEEEDLLSPPSAEVLQRMICDEDAARAAEDDVLALSKSKKKSSKAKVDRVMESQDSDEELGNDFGVEDDVDDDDLDRFVCNFLLHFELFDPIFMICR